MKTHFLEVDFWTFKNWHFRKSIDSNFSNFFVQYEFLWYLKLFFGVVSQVFGMYFVFFFVQNLNEKMKNSNFKPLTARSAHFQETAKQTGFWIDKQHSTINQKNDNFNLCTLLKTEP